jgi:hypothetical protein
MPDIAFITDARILSTVSMNIFDAGMQQSALLISPQTRSAEEKGWGEAPQASVGDVTCPARVFALSWYEREV